MTDDIVRVLRVLEYIGPRQWVEQTLRNGAVPANGERVFVEDSYGKPMQIVKSATIGQFPDIYEQNHQRQLRSNFDQVLTDPSGDPV